MFSRRIEVDDLDELVEAFEAGLVVETGASVKSAGYTRWVKETPGLAGAIARLDGGGSPQATAAAAEFILEGLHLNRRLNKDRTEGGGRYRR